MSTENGSSGSNGGLLSGGVNVFNGLMSWFKETLSWLGQQGIRSANGILNAVVRAATMTPAPNNVGNYYHNPTNLVFPTVYNVYQQTGQGLAVFAWVIGAGMTATLGNYIGIGLLNRAVEEKSWKYLGIGSIFMTPAGWTFVSLYLDLIDIIGQALALDFTQASVGAGGFKAAVFILVLIAIYFEVWLLIIFAIACAFRIEMILFITPIIPAALVARGIPVQIVSSCANALWKLWFILTLAGLPSGLLIAGSFNAAQSAMLTELGLGPVFKLIMPIGGIAAALAVPFAMYKAGMQMMTMGFGVSGMSSVTSKEEMGKKMGQYQEKASKRREQTIQAARGSRDFARGIRGKHSNYTGWHDDPTRSNVAGRAVRNAPQNLSEKGKSITGAAQDRASSMRDRFK